MFSIRLRNFRSIVDSKDVEIRPLTILVGKNNSGKSTLTRFLALLRQSITAPSNVPLLWYGDLVDFGSISEVRSRYSENKEIGFELTFPVSQLVPASTLKRRRDIFSIFKTIRFGLTLVDKLGSTVTSRMILALDDDTIEFTLSPDLSIVSVTINGVDFTELFPKGGVRIVHEGFVPQIRETADSRSEREDWRLFFPMHLGSARREIFRFYKNNLHGRFYDSTINMLVRRVRFANKRDFVENLKKTRSEYVSWNQLVKRLTEKRGIKQRERLRSLYLLFQLPEILALLDRRYSAFFSTICYLGPSRATGERYYRIQELAVDRIDAEGRNVAMFLNALSADETGEFSDWAEESLGFSVKTVRQRGHVSVILREVGSKQEFNLADVGYGISQILPIMVQVWAATYYQRKRSTLTVVAIEQPELHLHPAVQAQLADAFVGAVRRVEKAQSDIDPQGVALIVETHSRQLINRLGELVHKGKIPAKDIAIYVFDKEFGDAPTTISRARFDKDGDLRDWPFGFFSTGQEE